LTLKSGEIIKGIALDTQLDKQKNECMLLASQHDKTLVVLENITKCEVCIDNPHFQLLKF
jgi:Rho-binding antiterminator